MLSRDGEIQHARMEFFAGRRPRLPGIYTSRFLQYFLFSSTIQQAYRHPPSTSTSLKLLPPLQLLSPLQLLPTLQLLPKATMSELTLSTRETSLQTMSSPNPATPPKNGVCLCSTINLSALGAAQDARICRDWRWGHLVSHWSLSCVTEVWRRSWRRWRDVWFWHLQRRTRLRGRWRHGCVLARNS